MALRGGWQSKRVNVVFDTYKEIFIKNSELSVRGEAPGQRLQNITASHIVRQLRNFLSKVNNKDQSDHFPSQRMEESRVHRTATG